MLESVYITLIVLAFSTLIFSFFVNKLLQQVILLGISLILFGALGMSSLGVEMVVCTSASCSKNSQVFTNQAWIFAAFALISGMMFLIKIMGSFDVLRGFKNE